MPYGPRLIGLPRWAWSLVFPLAFCPTVRPFPQDESPWVHPRAPPSPFRVPSRVLPRPLFRRTACLPRFRSSSRRPRSRPPPREQPALATFRPQVFSTSRRFTPRSVSRAYSIPQPRPGFDRSGASPSAQPRSLVGSSFPPWCQAFVAFRPGTASTTRPSPSRSRSARRYVPGAR
jgi:hypothetical protein